MTHGYLVRTPETPVQAVEGRSTLGDILASDADTESEAARPLLRQELERAIDQLSPIQAQVIRARYLDRDIIMQCRIAGIMSRTHQRVSQIEAEALAALRKILREYRN